MKHMLMDPAFPDIVGDWARQEHFRETSGSAPVNDNDQAEREALSDPLLELVARAEIDATRVW